MHIIKQRVISLALSLGLLLGSYRGFVALFEEGNNEPRQVFPYKTESLPREDQLALEHGIPVPSEKALAHMLEDYMS